MNLNKNETVESLPAGFCYLIDLDETQKECAIQDPTICISCPIVGRYFAGGEHVRDYNSLGYVLILCMWVLTVVIGILGIFTNSLIIAVMRYRKCYRSFDFLIMALACFDMWCCASALTGTSVHSAIYQNWIDKGKATMYVSFVSTSATLFGRTGSTYMAMLISIERFVVIRFPFRSTWFTSTKTTLLVVAVLLFSFFLNLPRFLSYRVEYNDYENLNISSLAGFQYLIKPTDVCTNFYVNFRSIHILLDFWLPLPILLVLNLLSYLQIRKIQHRRTEMKLAQQKEVEAMKLFLPVVIALFVSNILPIMHTLSIVLRKTWYRELGIAVGLSVVINAAVNFFIYWYQRSTFKSEVKAVISQCNFLKPANQQGVKQREGKSETETCKSSQTNIF